MKENTETKEKGARTGARVTLQCVSGFALSSWLPTPFSSLVLYLSLSLSLSLSLAFIVLYHSLNYYLHDLLSSPLLSWQAKLSRRVSMIDRIRQQLRSTSSGDTVPGAAARNKALYPWLSIRCSFKWSQGKRLPSVSK